MNALAPHRLVLLALVTVLIALAVVAAPAVAPAQAGARPAAVPLPALPGIEDPDPTATPAARPLERDSALVDRFTAPGQVRYPFRAEAGELSLFELFAAGYARGWSMSATLRVTAGDGRVLTERTRSGGVQLHAFLAFQAPETGEYRLELVASDRMFRYAVVRHGSYAPHGAAPRSVGDLERVHDWVGGDSEAVVYDVPVRAGEVLALSLEGSREEARAERRRALADRADAATMAGMRAARMQGDRGRPGPQPRFPELNLELAGEAGTLSTSPTFVLLAPAGADGVVRVRAGVAPGEPGGLFDLVVRRDVPRHAIHGVVVDADDEALGQIEVRFLLEPDLEPWGQAVTDATGAYAVDVPAGDYRVELRREGLEAVQAARAGVSGAGELNLLWRGP